LGVTANDDLLHRWHAPVRYVAAGWLESCGLPLSNGGSIEPDLSNPQGYFEDLDFAAACSGSATTVPAVERLAAGAHGLLLV
jgi:hypothetical protein